ncbi:MAG TPA: hypothetical protein VMB34_02040 [Acetobacteraceae bacterium]|nr:hypothetical protein [Acetobacteraceae bacterium]
MGEGRLLGSVCALALMFAGPAFAATGDASSGNSVDQAASQNNSAEMNGNSTGMTRPNPTAGATSGVNAGGMGMNNGTSPTGMDTTGTSMGSQPAMSNGTNAVSNGAPGGGHMSTAGSNANMGGMNANTTGMNSGRPGNATSAQSNYRHDRAHHAMRSSRNEQRDTSQNGEVDRLNQQSLQAARSGQSFSMGSAEDGGGSGNSVRSYGGGGGAAQPPGSGPMNGQGAGGAGNGTSGGQHM